MQKQILEVKQELQNPKQIIKEHLKTLQKIKIAKAEKCDKLRAELEELEKPFDIEAEAIEIEIFKIIPEIGESIKTESGMVKRIYRKASIRRHYPREDIDNFLDTNPEIEKLIRPLMKKTEIPESIKYEVEVY